MTDTDVVEPVVAKARPVRRPPARKAPVQRAALSPVEDLQRQNGLLMARLEVLERNNTMQFIESEPLPKPVSRIADPEELTDFQKELRAATRPMPKDFKRDDKSFNWPRKWFARPDGDIVELQGDPQNQAFYQDIGFHLLDAEQTRRWLSVERPKVRRVQQARAHLINNLRRVVNLDPALKAGLDPQAELDWDHMSVKELEGQWDQLNGLATSNGRPRITLPRLKRFQDADDARAVDESERLLAGVETNGSDRDYQRFHPEGEQPPRPTREVEVTKANANLFA